MLTYPALTNQISGNTAGATALISSGTMVLAGGNNITLSQAGNSVTISAGAGGAGDGLNRISAGTQIADTLATVLFNNNAAISFGMSNSSVITATHNGITTGRASNDAIGLNTALTAGPLAWTVNSSGLSLNASSVAGTTSGFGGNLISGSMTHNTAGLNLSLNHPAWLTTARGSTDAIGLNTAQSNVTWTVNSSGLSLDARGYAGTGTTFAANGLSASMTLNSNGLNVSLSDGTGALTMYATSNTTQSSTGTMAESSMIFAGAGIASVGITNGSVVISVPAGGGAGDGGVFAGVSDLGNTAGSTGTVSTGNFVLVGSNGISLSQSTGAAGSAATVSIIGPAPLSRWQNHNAASAGGAVFASNSASIFPVNIPEPLNASQAQVAFSVSVGTAANNSSGFFHHSGTVVLYTRNGSSLSSIASGSFGATSSFSSNATGSIVGPRIASMTLNGSTAFPPGEYWAGCWMFTTNTATGGAATTALGGSASMAVMVPGNTAMYGVNYIGQVQAASRGISLGLGVLANGATQGSIAFSGITQSGTRASAANMWLELRNYSIW